MYLLDTNILSDAAKPKPIAKVAAWLHDQQDIAIPFPVILEIEQGIRDVAVTRPDRALELTAWLDGLMETRFVYPAVTVEVARKLAHLHTCKPLKNFWCHHPEAKQTRPSQDLFIAAISIVHQLPIATINGRDFRQIDRYFPLPGVYDPSHDAWIVRPAHDPSIVVAPHTPSRRRKRRPVDG